MKKLSLLCVFAFLFSGILTAQSKVQYQDMSFERAMYEAGKTNKMIFVSVENQSQAEGIRKAEEQIFAIDSIADFLNKNCIAIRVDMGTEEGKKYAPYLQMLMYPVYVFHDGKGDQLSFINSTLALKNPAELMAKAHAADQIATVKRKNKRSIVFNTSSWDAVLAKAKKEKKLIFVDAYTTWCRPCIQMAKDVFTLNKVADFYNDNFINVTMDMEKGVGPSLAKKYDIKAYPTYLFVDGSGKLVYKDGGFQEADIFVQTGEKALKSKKNKS